MYNFHKIDLYEIARICGFSIFPDEIAIRNKKNENGYVSSMKLTCSNKANQSFLRLNIDDLEKDNINVTIHVSIPVIFKDGNCVIDHSIIIKSEILKLEMQTLNDYYQICIALTGYRPSYTAFKFILKADFSKQEVIYSSCYLEVETIISENLGKIIYELYGVKPTHNLSTTINTILHLNDWVYSSKNLTDLLSVIEMQRI